MEVKGGGALVANGFWMDMIKTHCYATFESEACAAQAREGLWGLQWPDERGGTLKAEFADVTAMEVGGGGWGWVGVGGWVSVCVNVYSACPA